MKRIKKTTRGRSRRRITPEYLAQLIEAYNYYFYHYDETPLLVVDTNEIDFVNRPADFDDLVAQIQKAKKGRPVLRSRARPAPAEIESPPSRSTARAYNSCVVALVGGDPDLRDVDRKERSERWPNLSAETSPSPFPQIVAAKGRERIAMLTAYDAPIGGAARRGRRRRPARRRLGRDDGLRRAEHADRDDGLDGPPHAGRRARGQARRSSSATCPSSPTRPSPRAPSRTPAASSPRAARPPSRSRAAGASSRRSRRSSPRTSR